MRTFPRKAKIGLLFLAVLLGGVLPTLCSLFWDPHILIVSLSVSISLGILLFLAQSAPLWISLTGGYLIMTAAMMTRIPLYASLPFLLLAYEAFCFLGLPLILVGVSRMWLRMALSIRLAFLFSAVSLLAVFLLMQCGWSFVMEALDVQNSVRQPVLPELSGILLSLFAECGTYVLLSLLFQGKEQDRVSLHIG